MKRRITKILILFVLSLFLCVCSFAQNKIAAVNSYIFYDEKSGIKELVTANKKLEEEFAPSQKELKSLNDKLSVFLIELDKCAHDSCKKRSYEEAQKMMLEMETLSEKVKEITGEINTQIEKRKAELIEPINKRIAEKLELYRTTKSYKKIFDLGDNKIASAILGIDMSIDITNEFIKFCNEEFEKEKTREQGQELRGE